MVSSPWVIELLMHFKETGVRRGQAESRRVREHSEWKPLFCLKGAAGSLPRTSRAVGYVHQTAIETPRGQDVS